MDAIPWGGGVTAYDGPYGEAPLVEAYKRVGKSVIWVCERVQKLTDEFYGFIKSRKRSIFMIDSFGCQNINKGYHLSIEGIRKGNVFRGKWYIKG